MILTVTLNPCIDKTIWIDKGDEGSVIRARETTFQSGGKGNNVSRVLTRLGVKNRVLTLAGGPTGVHLKMLLELEGIDALTLDIDGLTRMVTTVVERGTYRQTAYVEPGPAISAAEVQKLMEAYRKELVGCDIIVLSGSVPNEELSGIYQDMIEMANARGKKVWLDSRGKAFRLGLTAQPYFIKPNLEELEEALGRTIERTERTQAVQELMEKNIPCVLLTLGEEGALMGYQGEVFCEKSPEIQLVNPVGSGDSFTAGFLFGFNQGMPLAECLKLGCRAGAINASMWEAAWLNSL